MKKIQKHFIWILTIVFLIVLSVNSFAAKGSFSLSKTSVSLTEGGKTTVSIKATNCEGRFSISSSNTNVVKVSTSSAWIAGSTSITLTAVKSGTAKITITAYDVADTSENVVSGSKTISVTVKAKSSSTTSDNGTGNSSTKPTFTSTNKKVYAKDSINLRSSWSTSSSATPVSKGTEMTLTGTSSKSVNGYVWYRVSYNGSTKYVASSLVTTTKPNSTSDKKDGNQKDDDKSGNDENKDDNIKNSVNLKLLSVTPTGLSPVFSKGVTEYTMTVGSDISKIDIKAVPEDSKASVNITGNTGLKIGSNKITVTVTAADKKTKVYHIIVTKEDKKLLQLSELLVEGLPLTPEFDSNIYEYTLKMDRSDVSEVNITATPSKRDAKVEIVGNTDLQTGDNVVTILVKSADEKEIATYQITVNIPSKEEAPEEKKVNKEDLYLYIGVGVGVLVILIIIIALIRKHHKKDEENMYVGMYNPKGNDEEKSDESSKVESLQTDTNTTLEELPKLNDEDLPKSLRKDNTILSEQSTIHDEEVKTDRSKKIDEFYRMEDEERPRRKGKHSK